MWQSSPRPVPSRIKMPQKYTLSHKNFAKIHCLKGTLKMSVHMIPCRIIFKSVVNTLSHNFYQKRTPCRIISTVKGHTVQRHIPLSQVWEYPPPPGRVCSQLDDTSFIANDTNTKTICLILKCPEVNMKSCAIL